MTFQGAPDPAAQPVAEDGAPTFMHAHDGTPIRVPKGYKPMKTRNVLLLVGCMILFMVSFLPMLDAFRLLENQTFVFFVGRSWPRLLLWACIGNIFLYMFLILAFFSCAQDTAKTDHSVLLICAVVLTTMGLSFLMVSIPLKRESMLAYEEIFTNCQFGPRTQRLYEYSTVLQGIRASPTCSVLKSVTMCDGYQESMPYTGFLNAMESQYSCTGFCYGNSTSAAAAVAVAADTALNTLTTSAPGLLADIAAAAGAVGDIASAVGDVAASPTGTAIAGAVGASPDAASQTAGAAGAVAGIAGAVGDAATAAQGTSFYSRVPVARATRGYEMESLPQRYSPADTNLYGSQMMMDVSPEANALFDANIYDSQSLSEAIEGFAPQTADNRMLKGTFLQTSQTSSSKDEAPSAAALPRDLKPHDFAGFSKKFKQAPGPPVLADTTTPTLPNMSRATMGALKPYPPTLFSSENFQASCDGMAALDLKYEAMQVSQMVYCEGIFLLGTVLVGALLRICGLCIQLPSPRWKKPVLSGAAAVH